MREYKPNWPLVTCNILGKEKERFESSLMWDILAIKTTNN